MKKALIAVLVLLIAGFTIKSCMAVMPKKNLKPSDYDLGLTYDKAMSQSKPIIAMFYTDWCTYCIRFVPKLNTVRNTFKDEFNFVLIDMEKPQNKALTDKYKISYFPTIYIIDPKYDNLVHIDGAYLDSVDSFSKEVLRYTKIRKLIEKGDICRN